MFKNIIYLMFKIILSLFLLVNIQLICWYECFNYIWSIIGWHESLHGWSHQLIILSGYISRNNSLLPLVYIWFILLSHFCSSLVNWKDYCSLILILVFSLHRSLSSRRSPNLVIIFFICPSIKWVLVLILK